MGILEKLSAKSRDRYGEPIPVIAFLGDSVTQGCFEVYTKADGSIETIFDQSHAYSRYFSDLLATLYPDAPVTILNAGISGDSAPGGLKRLQRDVLSHRPDLTVVCFGLNDCGAGPDGMRQYTEALDGIFSQLLSAGSEVIFMTPNMMCTHLSPHLLKTGLEPLSDRFSALQNDGVLTAYLEAARAVAAVHGVPVCDVYSKWQRMAAAGVDTTELLSNHLNHPTRDMNRLFAVSLLDTVLEG